MTPTPSKELAEKLHSFPLSSRIGFLYHDVERVNPKKMTKAHMKTEFLRLLNELYPMVKALEDSSKKGREG